MLRVSSDIAVATNVRSTGPNPSAAASSRPFWRAEITGMSRSRPVSWTLRAQEGDWRPRDRGNSGVLTLSDAQCDADAGGRRSSAAAADRNPHNGPDGHRAPEPAAPTA